MEIEVLMTPGCKPCDTLKALLREVLTEAGTKIGKVDIREKDVLDNPETVLKYGILSTPALIINGRLLLTGVPRRGELLEAILREATRS